MPRTPDRSTAERTTDRAAREAMAAATAASLRRAARGAVMARLLLTAAVIAVPTGAEAARAAKPLVGEVTMVADGDSLFLRVAEDLPPVEIRLHGIDAPERCQPFGPEALEGLRGYVVGHTVTAEPQGKDRYGRTLAVLTVDGLNVNERMVAEGYAWSLQGRSGKGPYLKQQRVAQALHRGLFADRSAQQPADFRRQHGPCPTGAAASAPAGGSAGAN